jgi:hypothetical protein
MRLRHRQKTQPTTSVAGETSDRDEIPDTNESADELEPADEPAVSFTLSLGSGRSRVISFDYGAGNAAFRAGMPALGASQADSRPQGGPQAGPRPA